MNYLLFICSDGRPTPEELAAIQRELPGWVEEMDGRGVRLLGRELELPEAAATVRVRRGETLVSDGPFTETKEFIAGFDLLECADLDEAIEVAAKHATSWFHMIEVRPTRDGVRLGETASAFARFEDSAGTPYMLIMWMGDPPAVAFDDQAVMDESGAWRRDVEARGFHVLGSALEGPDTATTVRVRDGETLLSDGPFIENKEFVGGVEVVSCADRQQALELAAAHPLARYYAIEVRPFYSE
ncbi:MAG: YciI family protein [Solirubrobacteraceae bacterium]